MRLTRVFMSDIDLPQLEIIPNTNPDPNVIEGFRQVELVPTGTGKFRIRTGLPHIIFLAQQGFQDVWATIANERRYERD